MKAKLLKKLRKEANKVYFLKSDYPYYCICKKSFTRMDYMRINLLFGDAKSELNRYRRRFILREVKTIRDKKINKYLKKL